jgi:hypothetical protein
MARSDLTGYAALLGESLSSRVGLLERLLRDAHYPSLGQYKERILADAIKDYLPRTIEVGTGFVMFPHADEAPPGGPEMHDPLNQSAYSISRQCDILVYDISRFPPIFRDRDFVVIRPEAVRAVIEVKGSLSVTSAREALESFHDFASKWRATQVFYLGHAQPTTPAPGLFVMAWEVRRDRSGRPMASPTRLRELVTSFYTDHVNQSEVDGYPFLQKLLIHNESEIFSTFGIDMTEEGSRHSFGWSSRDGRFIRVDENGELFRDKDRTVASLLAALHWIVAKEDFNRFFSYVDEVSDSRSLPYEHSGTSWAWTNVPDVRLFTAQVPQRRASLHDNSGRLPLVPAACQNGAETRDIDQHQDDNETGPDQHRSR